MNIKNGILNVPKHGNKHDLIHFVTHGHCVVNPQMLSQEKFQELHFVQDPVLGDDGTYIVIGILLRWLGTLKVRLKQIDMCVYCNPTEPLYNSLSENVCPDFPRYSHKTKQKLAIGRKKTTQKVQ